MARVGRFGRNRRQGASNLTQLIANLMREQRQAEDRAAFDAWQNGGEFKGAKMTDDRIIAYIKTRRNGFTTDDPLWDQWNNSLIQTRFGIGEQKIGLAFKQGKVSAGAVAGWYRKQLASIPKDSQFYRTVAGRAADWAKSAAGSARSGGRSSAGSHTADKKARLERIIGNADSLTAAIEQEAKRRGIIDRDGSIWDADASRLTEMFAQGVTINGKPVTYSSWQQSQVRAYAATNQMTSVYKANGWDTSSLGDNKRARMRALTTINAIDDRAKYETARDLWIERLAGAEGDPSQIDKINQEYAADLARIHAGASSATGQNENEAAFIGGLVNEVNALTTGKYTGPTVADSFDIEKGDGESTAQSALQNKANMEMLASGAAILGQTEPGGTYQVIPDPLGAVVKDPSMQRVPVNIGGAVREVYLKGTPIRSGTIVSPTGSVMPVDQMTGSVQSYLDAGYKYKADGKTLGYQFATGKGEQTWGVYAPDGTLKFTNENPFGDNWALDGEAIVVVGSPVDGLDPNSAADPATMFGAGVNPATFAPVPITQGTDPNTLAGYFAATGDEADAATAAAIRATYGTPTTVGGAQVSDSQMERYNQLHGNPGVSTNTGFSLAQSSLRDTMDAIQGALTPYFSPTSQQAQPTTPQVGLSGTDWLHNPWAPYVPTATPPPKPPTQSTPVPRPQTPEDYSESIFGPKPKATPVPRPQTPEDISKSIFGPPTPKPGGSGGGGTGTITPR